MARTRIQSSDIDLQENRSVEIGINPHIPLEEQDTDIQIASAYSLQDERTLALLEEEKQLRAFMEEPVTFTIGLDNDPNAPDPVSCGVNGIVKHFKRGEIYTTKRKFVESLLKTRNHIKTVEYEDADRVKQTRIDMHQTFVYPIQILEDPSGVGPGTRGRRWMEYQQRNG
jgi:hypothetical protein